MNDRGFVLVFMLYLLPIIFTGFAFVSLSYSYILSKNQSVKSCQKISSLIQLEIKKLEERLININPKAKKARNWMRTANQLLKSATASGNGPAIAIATVNYLFAKANQAKVAGEQAIARSQIQFALLEGPLKFKSEFHKQTKSSTIDLEVKTPSVKWIKNPMNSITPSYYRGLNFSDHHTFEASWKVPLFNLKSNDTKTLINKLLKTPTTPFSKEISCATTIRKKGKEWIVYLTKDRSY